MRYHNITKDDMLNGEGLRVVLWLSGCTHHCKGCQNPITWNVNEGLIFDQEAKKELYAELEKDYISGITFSGGDPLHPLNIKEVGELIKEIKKNFPTKNIWLYTGFNFEDIEFLPFINKIDVICDGEYVAELRNTSLSWVGSSNQKVIDVKKSLKEKKIILKGE